MKTKLLKGLGVVLFCLQHSNPVFAQYPTTTGYQAALGQATLTDTSAWALFHNPASYRNGSKSTYQLICSDQYRAGLSELKSKQVGLLWSKAHTMLGATFQKFGYTYLQYTSIGIHAAHQVQTFQLSGSFYYDQWLANELYKVNSWHINFGGTWNLQPKWVAGIWVSNVTWNKVESMPLPMALQVGVKWKVSTEVEINTELHLTDKQPQWHNGILYHIHPNITVMGGWISGSQTLSAGFSVHRKLQQLGYSYSIQSISGSVHHLFLRIGLCTK